MRKLPPYNRCSWVLLCDQTQEASLISFKARKYCIQIAPVQLVLYQFCKHRAEIRRDREVTRFVKFRRIEARPSSVDASSSHWPSQHEHHVGMSVVGTAVAVFVYGASEFRHGDDDRILGKVAKVRPERREGLAEIAQYVGNLSFGAAFIHVMVPSADVGERNLHAEIRL